MLCTLLRVPQIQVHQPVASLLLETKSGSVKLSAKSLVSMAFSVIFSADIFVSFAAPSSAALVSDQRSIKFHKWPDKSSTSYDMLDFKSYIKNL